MAFAETRRPGFENPCRWRFWFCYGKKTSCKNFFGNFFLVWGGIPDTIRIQIYSRLSPWQSSFLHKNFSVCVCVPSTAGLFFLMGLWVGGTRWTWNFGVGAAGLDVSDGWVFCWLDAEVFQVTSSDENARVWELFWSLKNVIFVLKIL